MLPDDVLLQKTRLGNTIVAGLVIGKSAESGGDSKIKEPPPKYSTETVLFDLWEKLLSNNRGDPQSVNSPAFVVIHKHESEKR